MNTKMLAGQGEVLMEAADHSYEPDHRGVCKTCGHFHAASEPVDLSHLDAAHVIQRAAASLGPSTFQAWLMSDGKPIIEAATLHSFSARWQPIETAPKDGTTVLVVRGGKVAISSYERTEDWRNGKLVRKHEYWPTQFMSWMGEPEPTLWMPLLELPVAPSD